MVRNWLALTVEYELVSHEWTLLAMVWCLGLFYSDDGMVGLYNPEWLQGAFNVLIGLFRRYGLVANVSKSKTIMCQMGEIRSGMSVIPL